MDAKQAPEAEQVRAAVERIVASKHLIHAESVANLLKYIVEQTLNGKAESLKEYTLGVEVFQRGPNFNPKEDTIVRVQARALRSRLESYYETDGRNDPIRVIVPKGAYVPTFETATPPGKGASASSHVRVWVGAAIVTAVVLVASWSAWRWPSQSPGCRTLAVLPFDTPSAPDLVFLGPALAQELVTRLSEVPGLALISFQSALRHKQSGNPLPELNAGCVVDGSLVRTGDEVEVQAFLKDGTSGRTLWTQSFRRSIKDISRLEAELSEALANQAVPNFRPARVGGQPSAIDSEAVLLYLEAKHEFNKYHEPGFRRSIELFEQAIQRQPDYALAHAGLAYAWFRLSNFYVPPHEGMPKARAAAQRALELAPGLAEAHALMAAVALVYEWDPVTARMALQRASTISPSLALVHEIQALYHISVGKFDQALANLRTARERDPLSLPPAIQSQFGLLVTRKYQDAIEPGLRAVARNPNAGLLRALVGVNLIYAGRNPEGVEHLEAIMRVDHSYPVALLAATGFAHMGSEARARRILTEVKGQIPRNYVCAYEVASVHAELGESDEAFEWLDKARKARCDCMLWVSIEPWFDSLRGDPRYPAFSRDVTFH